MAEVLRSAVKKAHEPLNRSLKKISLMITCVVGVSNHNGWYMTDTPLDRHLIWHQLKPCYIRRSRHIRQIWGMNESQPTTHCLLTHSGMGGGDARDSVSYSTIPYLFIQASFILYWSLDVIFRLSSSLCVMDAYFITSLSVPRVKHVVSPWVNVYKLAELRDKLL